MPKKYEVLIKWRPKTKNLRAPIRERYQKSKNFFNLQAKKDPGFPAKWICKWICRDCFRPGVTPCGGQLKKNRRKWQRHKNDFSRGTRILAISISIFNAKALKTRQRTPNKVLHKTRLLQLGAPSNPIWDICRQIQNFPIFAHLGPKIAFLVNKVVDLGKTSAGQSSYIMSRRPWANFQQNLLETFQNRLNLPPSCPV